VGPAKGLEPPKIEILDEIKRRRIPLGVHHRTGTAVSRN
jgi:hypothetical protein